MQEVSGRKQDGGPGVVEFVRRHELSMNGLIEAQFAEAIRQAVACGDFQRLVVASGAKMSTDGAGMLSVTEQSQVIYVPFAQEEKQRSRISRLEEALEKHGIQDPDSLKYSEDDE